MLRQGQRQRQDPAAGLAGAGGAEMDRLRRWVGRAQDDLELDAVVGAVADERLGGQRKDALAAAVGGSPLQAELAYPRTAAGRRRRKPVVRQRRPNQRRVAPPRAHPHPPGHHLAVTIIVVVVVAVVVVVVVVVVGDDDGVMAGAGLGFEMSSTMDLRVEYVMRDSIDSFQVNLVVRQ